jgi:hypothetical protein
LSVSINKKPCRVEAVLTGYAYETVAGKPIITGATSANEEASGQTLPNATLGALALGSTGVVARRQEESAN